MQGSPFGLLGIEDEGRFGERTYYVRQYRSLYRKVFHRPFVVVENNDGVIVVVIIGGEGGGGIG